MLLITILINYTCTIWYFTDSKDFR